MWIKIFLESVVRQHVLDPNTGYMSELGGMFASNEYILACDERGTTRWPSRTKTWAMGGFIIEASRREELVSNWKKVKLQLCGNQDCELKWSHFFPGRHQKREPNPLLSTDPQEWREQASWAISELFNAVDIFPVNVVVRKDRASDAAFDTTVDGRKVLDSNTLWVGVLAQFALFLKEHSAMGEVWFDQLGSRAEEVRKQVDWENLRDGEWPVNPENQALLKCIEPTLSFFDSQAEPLVQIADFISGVIWAASEGDEEFLLKTLNKYFPRGPHTYTLFKVE